MTPDLSFLDVLILLAVGLLTGAVGGMIGIGGSLIIIPALAFLFSHRAWTGPDDQHLFQAAAMIVNVAVAVPAALRHRRAGAVRRDLFRLMLPATAVAVIAGVLVSNIFEGRRLQQLFAVFLLYVVADSILKLIRRTDENPSGRTAERITIPRAGFVGASMGFMAGLLGIGGGNIAVPLAHILCRVPLRQCIATTASVMCLTSLVGAALKVGTLESHGQSWHAAALLALVLSPTAVVGGYIGAGLTHSLSLAMVRVVFIIVLLAAAAKMFGLY